ncbi:MAG: hypothetical protein JETCAE03_36940 [Ignavibacteriaceae bacterium]|uniref:hypothetical protein n=1 Tax=Ignavibacterium album TaxID=591197 RepID=UPI0020832C3C|nr:hypothetical protein [Ignavibacterium album]MBI5662924.1 hypothetical protein [Ignavibacterium album]GJQ44196.1 MAG: hypothetical protein JETCAE03_36940 [Ignavibacteriaceae bacterium]
MKIKEKEFEQIIDELKQIASQLGVSVRFEKGDFKGGFCIVKENKIIVINKFANTQRKAAILATALKELGIDDIYINPRLREIIDEMTETL